MRRFEAAPWSTALRLVSFLGAGVLLAVGYTVGRAIPRTGHAPVAEAAGRVVLPVFLLVVVGSLLFVVTGYHLEGTSLLVHRPLWQSRIDLRGLERVWHDPAAMRRSLRLFGNGGLFSITGLYRNSTLGTYRAFVTDPARAVVLRSPARVVVVSPASPLEFVSHVATLVPGVAVGPAPRRA